MPVTIDEVLLRGCTLKNSGRIAGLVVYTGAESRIQMNAAKPPRKSGAALQSAAAQPLVLTRHTMSYWHVCRPSAACTGIPARVAANYAASSTPCASASLRLQMPCIQSGTTPL